MSRREMWTDEMTGRVEALDAEVAMLRAALRSVEWDHAECRACDGHQHQGGHVSDCTVAAALRLPSQRPAGIVSGLAILADMHARGIIDESERKRLAIEHLEGIYGPDPPK